ncbi:hypothetical protein [Rathayibacter soli]|uniref:hypothetical protein n=1 Tax=Rathayibacter soli TaxID=3144168 RepID=UPI0027E57898|nr:hypothetical protein [Glaciibacter superstes]
MGLAEPQEPRAAPEQPEQESPVQKAAAMQQATDPRMARGLTSLSMATVQKETHT